MSLTQNNLLGSLVYQTHLDKVEEAVISSHFMHKLSCNTDLKLYDDDEFKLKAIQIDSPGLYGVLIPSLVSASNAFCRERALAAKIRARENFREYRLRGPCDVSVAQFITEVMFDRQYVRGAKETCSRELVCKRVKKQVESSSPIEMVIPALPFKIFSPLKTRGRLPDLAEVNFILGLYEIVATIELLYREEILGTHERLAGFTVVSDGSRFNELVGEPACFIDEYRDRLRLWIERLGLSKYITLLDYRALLRDKLPTAVWWAKSAITDNARQEYADKMWPILNSLDMDSTMRLAAKVEPDPECSNPEGRFISLLKSLVYTINYRCLEQFVRLPTGQYNALYRELTRHIFQPYAYFSDVSSPSIQEHMDVQQDCQLTDFVKERLRQLMIKEVWTATIEYMAEIKSGRELAEDPIMLCLPDHFRWSIHPKAGQSALLTPTALGIRVQPWAGTAVFKLTKEGGIKLCTLPVIALEGAGAVPVIDGAIDHTVGGPGQPLFYIFPDFPCANIETFFRAIKQSLVRNRRS